MSTATDERVARWEGTAASAGTYLIWARWPAALSHSFAANYTITTPGGASTATVNQRIEGGKWHLIKTITLAANDNWKVELSDQSPGEVIADAIAITPPLSLSDHFDWSPTLPATGDYAVFAKWQAAFDRATDATYEVTHTGGVAQVKVDQSHNGGEWRYLGTWNFDPSLNPKVSLLASLNGTVNADAIRFVSGDAIGGDIAYTPSDQIGTIQKMTDASGTAAWDRTARPFGETVAITAASGVDQKLRFPGQYADETGLNYNYFRDYDSTLGRYAESDPIGLGGGINTYSYALANPFMKIDPLGQAPLDQLYLSAAPSYPNSDLEPKNGTQLCEAKTEAECEKQYEKDIFECKMFGKRSCYEQAAKRYAACLKGEELPPLSHKESVEPEVKEEETSPSGPTLPPLIVPPIPGGGGKRGRCPTDPFGFGNCPVWL